MRNQTPTPLSFLFLALPAGPWQSSAVLPRFERLSDSGTLGVVTIGLGPHFDEELRMRHERGGPFLLAGLPMPGGESADLELRPVSALEPGARAQVVLPDGSIELREPRASCFAGCVVGGGTAFLGVAGGQLDGYLYSGGELYFLSSGRHANGEGARKRVILSHASKTGNMDPDFCGLTTERVSPWSGDGEEVERAVTPILRTADVFIEADHMYRGRFSSDQECIDYTALLFAAASEIYRRDIGTRLRIPDRYLRVWQTTPPWGAITGFPSLKNVYNYWLSNQNPLRNLPRAAVHVLTHPIFGGTSRGVTGLCDNVRAYEISSVSGSFPYPIEHTDRYNWDLFVVCHELGHTFGSPHSSLYQPPIQCADGSGPDSGTIMSYCHSTYGIAQVGMRFHYREQQRIRGELPDSVCLRSQALLRGDYDGSGVADESDLAALRAVLSQGFRSIAAEEVLDVDADGRLTAGDHELLAETVFAAPPASVAVRNGGGTNPYALKALANPVLGTIWPVRVDAGGGGNTLLVCYDLPHPGVMTLRGELLVSTAPLGGTKLFTSTAASSGSFALHQVPLPLDLALAGREVTFQALVTSATGEETYTNALDVVLSPYEAYAGQ